MNTYFSTFIPGTGEIIKSILPKQLEQLEISLLLDGLIVYRTTSPIENIKQLRFFNNSFLFIKQFNSLQSNPLTEMAKQIIKTNLPMAIKQYLPNKPTTFRIVTQVTNQGTKLDKNLLSKLESKICEIGK